MVITKQHVAEKIAGYLDHRMSLAQLVEWAEQQLMDGEFDEKDAATIAAAVSRLGTADVRAFGLTWADCEEILRQLGFSARVNITAS